MSIRTCKNTLTDSQRDSLLEDLEIKSDRPDNHFICNATEHDDWVYIPFHYAGETLGIHPSKTLKCAPFEFRRDSPFIGELRPYQKEVKKVVLDEINKSGVVLLSVHVGWGKSIFSIWLAHRTKLKTMIVVNKIALIHQWTKLIETFIPDSKVQVLSAKKPIDTDTDFLIANICNINKKPIDHYDRFGTVICDEIHLLLSLKGFPQLLHLTPRFLIGLSATPYRMDELNACVRLFFGDPTITKALHRPYQVRTIHTPFVFTMEMASTGRLDWNSVLDQQGESEARNRMIIDIVAEYPQLKFLILCKRISQGEILHRICGERGIPSSDLTGNNEFDTTKRVLIATTKKFGTGVSVDDLTGLILACDVEAYYIQFLGRVFRDPKSSPFVFDLIDSLTDGVRTLPFCPLKKHAKERRKVYRETGGIFK